MADRRRVPLPVSRLAAAAVLADLLRSSLVEVVGAADVSMPYPIRVSPWNTHQLTDVLRVCAYHRVSWSLDTCAQGAAGEFDVIVSLAMLACGRGGAPGTDARRSGTGLADGAEAASSTGQTRAAAEAADPQE